VLVLLGIAFLAGVITAISPCVLPVLPIVLAGGVSGQGRGRPLAIMAGLVASFTVFTLAGAWLLDSLGLPADTLRTIALVALFLLAATLVWPWLGHQLERPFLRLTRYRAAGDANGLLLGVSLGLVFVPCAGPVLAAVTVLSATGQLGVRSVAVTIAYALGAAVPMLLFALGSERLSRSLAILRTHAAATRRVAGVLVAATAAAIALGVDERFTTAVPGYTQALQNRIEDSAAARQSLADLGGGGAPARSPVTQRAPEFREINAWLNTDGRPLTLASLRGKVVLVDFWTYSCVNCLRTLPHLKAWDAAYRDAGLVIVGVHSPEFAFERDEGNVREAVRRLAVRYPVAMDNAFGTWKAYGNRDWPTEYLLDRTGRVRAAHYGEGQYAETEARIRELLGEDAGAAMTSVADRTPRDRTTPETYLGALRVERLANARLHVNGAAEYEFPDRGLLQDELAYAGRWRVRPNAIAAVDRARLRLRFDARHVYLVLGGTGRVKVLLNGRPRGTVTVRGAPRLYTLLDFPRLTGGLLELRFSPGVTGWAFTFG
jgi:cytochrome c biogenesis protein CcdA/thiol-disulfide isomerase/thioredoxin